MSEEKKQSLEQRTSAIRRAKAGRKPVNSLTVPSKQMEASAAPLIRLKPSSSDYQTFVSTTADAMGLPGLIKSKTKPDMRVLSLANLAS